LDSAIGQVIHKVDMCLCGAEVVVENGGLINKVGTLTLSLCAKA